eukprot:gene979-biopygen2327
MNGCGRQEEHERRRALLQQEEHELRRQQEEHERRRALLQQEEHELRRQQEEHELRRQQEEHERRRHQEEHERRRAHLHHERALCKKEPEAMLTVEQRNAQLQQRQEQHNAQLQQRLEQHNTQVREQWQKEVREMWQQRHTQLEQQNAQLQNAMQKDPEDGSQEVFQVKSARTEWDETWHIANIEIINNQVVNDYNNTVRIGDMTNISVEEIYETVVDTDKPRSCIAIGPEQCQKSAYIAIRVIVASLIRRPSVVFIKDVKTNVETTCNQKIGNILEPFGIKVMFVNDTKTLVKMSPEEIGEFKIGKIAIIAQTNHIMVQNVNEFVRKNKVFDIVMTLDEADAVFSSSIDTDNIGGNNTDTSRREQEFIKFADVKKVDDKWVPFMNGRIRCATFVSATHMSTINLFSQMGFEFTLHKMNIEAVKKKGYAVTDVVVPFKKDTGLPVWLPGPANKNNQYHLNSDETDMFMKEFVKDCSTPGRTGGLLEAVMSPYIISKCSTNANDVVKHLLCRYAEHSKNEGIKHPSDYVIGMVFSGDGVKLYEMYLKNKIITELPSGYEFRKPTVSEVIESIDNMYGLVTPIIVAGYKCVSRCASIRSDDRVLTHMIVTPTKGTNVDDVHQMIMRCGGNTTKERNKNGFGNEVKVLLQESDYNIIVILFDLVVKCLESGAKELIIDKKINEMLMTMLKDRPLAPWTCGKQLKHNNSLYDKENTRLAGKTLEDWKNCFTAYILRPVQSNPEAATGSVRPTATWEFVKKDGRVMAKYTNKKTSMETQPDRHRCKKSRRTEPTQQTVELVLDPVDPEEREVLNKRLRDENLMTNRVTSEVTKMLYRFCKLNPEFIGTRSDFEAGLKRFSRSPDASQQQLYDRNMQTFVQKRLLKQISSNPVKYQSNL